MTTKLVVHCMFSGVLMPGVRPIDPERAATELRRAGYEVSRPPDADVGPPGHLCLLKTSSDAVMLL